MLNKSTTYKPDTHEHLTLPYRHAIQSVNLNDTAIGTHWCIVISMSDSLHWRYNELDGFSDHQAHDSLLTRVTELCEGKSPVTGDFPAQKASNVENISIFSMTSSWYSVLKRSSSVFGWKWRPLWQSNQKYLTKMMMILLIYWFKVFPFSLIHYSECPLNTIASQINGYTTVCVTECLSQQQIKHHSFALLIICEGHLTLNDLFLHRRSVVRKTFPWHDVAMCKMT